MKKLFIIVSCVILSFADYSAKAQNTMNPSDPDVIFTSTNQPSAPTWNAISKWGHTNRLSWGPYANGYRSYYFQGMAFRLKFPKSYKAGVVDGKKYPLFLFFHGLGESGNIWDNEYQLFHGGQTWAARVDDSTFDGFLLVPQSQGGYLQSYFPAISSLLDSLVKYNKLDLDRVAVDGLSGGGQATWDFMATQEYAKKTASALPISAAEYSQESTFSSFVTIPIWTANGGQDVAPYPTTVADIVAYYKSLGGYILQTLYPNQGHGVWDSFWAEPNFWPWVKAQHKANPLVKFQHSAFCPNEAVNAVLKLQKGFYAYQWQKNGSTINGATADSLVVTDYGTYAGRFQRTATSGWSAWSPTPVVISQKQATVTPPIQINGLQSNVLPAPDGSTTVPLMVPNNYASYEWHNVTGGGDVLVGTSNIYNASVGLYKVRVTEQFGCSSNFSPVDTVVAASGTPAPDPAANPSAIAASSSSIQLNWDNNPTPQYNETGFEIYRTTTSGSNYKLVAINPTDALAYLDQGLAANTKYFYIVRAVNGNGAAASTSEFFATTKSDTTAPTAPTNLKVTGTTRSSVSLVWDASTDDVGVYRYDIYVNGVKAYSTANTSFTVNALNALQIYSFYVKARDISGNISPASSQVSAPAGLSGLHYNYYQGTWSVLPDFNTLTPFATGTTTNVTLAPALQTVNYGFLWQGYIKIPTTGTYTFETNSDDGSKLYIGQYSNSATAVVNNDGLHGAQSKTGNITLNAGIYPIAITFFQQGGGASMQVYWKNNVGLARQLIPDNAFNDAVTAGAVPSAPSALSATAASYKRINLTWTDNSTNETGFEVSRAIQRTGEYVAIGTTAAGATSFADSIGLSPNTKYWYRIRAVNTNGASGYVSTLLGAWLFNNDLTDGSGNNHSLTGSGNPTFSADAKEGSNSISFDGSSQYADMTFSSGSQFPSDAYTTRTVAVWIKPNASTISATNKIIISLGGSTNGLALRFNSGALQAGIASSSTRSTVNVSNIATNANWVSGGWNHVAVVYNVNSIQLFVNGVSVGTTSLSFSSVSSTATVSRVGASGGSNAFNSPSSSTNYGGLMDDIEILNEPLNAAGITALMSQTYTAATTAVLPAIPAAPSAIAAVAQSTSSVKLTFNDNSSNETGFEIYRSVGSANSFRLLTTIGANSTSSVTYIDNGLFANTNYFYHVRAIGVGGNSSYTSDANAVTFNNRPHISPIGNVAMRYASQVVVPVSATDADGDPLTFTTVNALPGFAQLVNNGNGTATLTFNPASTDQSTYAISVIAKDNHSGADTTSFTLVVNSNYVPVAASVSNQSMAEGDSLFIPVSANDQDGNGSLVWSLPGGPGFASVGTTTNGAATIKLKPGFADAGTYTITASVNDGSGGIATTSFVVTISNTIPPAEKIYMDMRYNSANAPAPWNNISGTSTTGLKNSSGATTSVGLNFLNTNWNAGNASNSTGNNSGVYPDIAMADYFWFGIFGAPDTVYFQLTGLNTASKYNVTLFASSFWTGAGANGPTVYTINGNSQSLNAANNQQNTVTFSTIAPDASGIITVKMSKATGTPYGMVNDIVLERPFNDGTAPVLPANLAAQTLSNGFIQLSWKDIAYNENNYLVYRSTNAAGPFTLLNPGATNANDTTYTDQTGSSNTTYYYKIEATNNNGSSGQTGVVSATTANKAPVLTAISDFTAKGGTSIVLNITGTDDASDVLTTTVSGLPSFATYQNTGNGTGKITFSPSVNDLGVYRNIAVKVTDNFGAFATDTFNLRVIDSSIRSVYLNLGPAGGIAQPSPWNNYLAYPFANSPFGNLLDDNGVNTGFSFKWLDQWDGGLNVGMIAGNDKGVFPDNVMQSSIYSGSTSIHTIEFDGLDPSKRYNFAFLTSFNSGDTAQVTFKNGIQTVVVDAKYNSTVLAQLNGITPSASGVVQITATKGKQQYLCLNAVQIQEYLSTTPIVRPYNLFAATSLDTSKITLTWSDRSSNETGFQIYRSTSVNGTYTLVTTTAANVTTYTNTGLAPNTRYYYKVRAVNASATSNYSNIATATLAAKIVLLHLDADASTNGPSPWNNTSQLSIAGATTSNMNDINLINTGFEMVITKEFNNTGFAGVTGSGIFPSNVMKGNYWTDAGMVSEVMFDNLDVRKKYRIGCFGSNASVNYTSANYTCNGQLVQLNSYNNNSKVVYLDKLVPNADGQLIVDIATVVGSPYSFTGAFTIEAFDDTDSYVPVSISRPELPSNNQAVTANVISTAAAANDIRVYPNPFNNKITVEMNGAKSGTVGLMLYDASSRLVYAGNTVKQAGNQTFNVNIPNAGNLKPGSYVLSVAVDGKLTKSVVLIKVN